MLRPIWITAVCTASVLVAPTRAQETPPATQPDPAPLFASPDLLEITIEAPLKSLLRDRDEDKESYDGTLRYFLSDGSPVTLDVSLRTRGRFRMKPSTCNFPPLRLNFKKSQAAETVFAGQDRLKLVTHCQDRRDEYEQYVLQEYLVYRTYNLLTDLSFRVRLARITYIDAERSRDPLVKYGFLIEDETAMATRNGWEVLEVRQVLPAQTKQDQLVLFEVFQFMMGNSDWDPFLTEPGSGACCHNAVIIGSMADSAIPVPYDFDWSGVISARYATPDPMLGIRNVRERRFWGICRPRAELDSIFPLFHEKREAIYELHRLQQGLDPKRLERTLEYYDEFYEIIGDPGKVRNDMERRCRQT
ncbi:MAG: hypothetical protein OEO20_08240 [Gemmatimonadota bacterium]|nr:hypothetical protein [Gemmatimonadota bacterium]MDH3367967.1 hypothetical protein [Gemmatimonadota bacterium]MDH3478276.1 hypothetical protein [Gemmatimonadota bacterium]MDH3570661.1 hypothetical protein [Gemmatimonadota bacterium]MDH5551394.1 hypothetical protein [Gemmatimonadota bacterium]